MTEARNDARDDFSVSMLADQHGAAGASIAERDHELLGVPKGQDNMATLAIERVHRFLPARPDSHRTADCTNDRRGDRRQR